MNWNSGPCLAESLSSLRRQRNVTLRLIVVDNASIDDSLERAEATGVRFEVLQTGRNLGYTGGNNVGFEATGLRRPVLVCNPDVAWTDERAVALLLTELTRNSGLAAVAPLIIERPAGFVEYLDSHIDLGRAVAIHTMTHLQALPAGTPAVKGLDWLDGAALLFRPEALRGVGQFDDRYFLLFEDVEWAIRARRNGWQLGLVTTCSVEHERSSSLKPAGFAGYYYFRNLLLLCQSYAEPRSPWRRHLLVSVLREVKERPSSLQPLLGVLDGLRGRWGRQRYG